ncbi:MAG: hypothetical protein QF632_03930 [Candidatus Woesearchaeota archaeon]|jgi:hypothetical protein|nr:hypothetical protein [Candidatus Woesearchaeota archaeon]MDP7323880.1 hypothetical protein [Candidatus Woesearchaeota archaeon]
MRYFESAETLFKKDLKALIDFGDLKQNYYWHRTRVRKLGKIIIHIHEDMVELQKGKESSSPYLLMLDYLKQLISDIEMMVKQRRPSAELQNTQANLANATVRKILVIAVLTTFPNKGIPKEQFEGMMGSLSEKEIKIMIDIHLLDSSKWVRKLLSDGTPNMTPFIRCFLSYPWEIKEGYSPREAQKCWIVGKLARLGDTESVEEIEQLTQSTNNDLVPYALRALQELKSTGSIQVIHKVLSNTTDDRVAESAINALGDLGAAGSIPLIIEKGLKDGYPSRQEAAMEALVKLNAQECIPRLAQIVRDSMSRDLKADAHKAILLLGDPNDPKYHRLYLGQDENFFDPEKRIARREFTKGGSRTILLGGHLLGKAIFRIVNPEAFEAWKKAYFAQEVWKDEGFDYVPVEPILMKGNRIRASPLKSGEYRVATKVLGHNMKTFISLSGDQKLAEQLRDNMKEITRILKYELKIEHGHIDYQNFCVEVLPDKVRLYLIDFDRAITLN